MRRLRELSLVLVAFVLCVIRDASTHPIYLEYIPNSDRVPSPCDPSVMWLPLGHNFICLRERFDWNTFGLKVASCECNWTKICPLDFDLDGRSNGVELGDPNCTWKRGQPSPKATYITNPGRCDPIGSAQCRRLIKDGFETSLHCPPPFNCPAIHQPEVKNLSILLPEVTVSRPYTATLCYGVVLPNDTDYHVIALKPTIANAVFDKQMTLYVCKEPPRNPYVFTHATLCQTDLWGCSSLMGIWSYGINGQCFANEYGFRIGPGGYQYAVLQVRHDYFYPSSPFRNDKVLLRSSGFTLFYTPRLRQYDGAILMTGQTYLENPPQQQSVEFSGGCSGLCAATPPRPVNIAASFLHIYPTGQSGNILLIRKRGPVVVLANETWYSYDFYGPIERSYNQSIPFLPGDQYRVRCNYYWTTRINHSRYYLLNPDIMGEECIAYITYYPANDNFTRCMQLRTTDDSCFTGFVDCDVTTFRKVASTLSVFCHGTPCSECCRNAMQILANTGCMSGNVGLFLQEYYMPNSTNLFEQQSLCNVSMRSAGERFPPTLVTSFASLILYQVARVASVIG